MKRLKKRLFARYEYQIGMEQINKKIGYWLDKTCFDEAEYKYRLSTYYVMVFLSIGYAGFLPMFFYADTPLWLLIELCLIVVLTAIIATLEPIQVARNLQRRLSKVPKGIKQNAKIVYKQNWRDAAVECYEAHILGDCPICGAV